MRGQTDNVLNRLMKEGLDTAQVRLHALEKDANKVLKGVRSRSRATQAQVADLLTKMEPTELLEKGREAEKEWTKAASRFVTQLGERVSSLQADILRLAGVASRNQLESIADDIERIGRKVDRLAKANAPSRTAGKASKSKDKPASGNA